MDAKLKRTTLRIPQDLYDRISESAGSEMTMNALITMTLLDAFPKPSEFAFAEIVNQWHRRIEATDDVLMKETLVSMANQEIRAQFDGSPITFFLMPNGSLGVEVHDEL